MEGLGHIAETPTEYLGLRVRTIVAKVMLRYVELHPVPEVFALHGLHSFRTTANDPKRVVAPASTGR
jgi:hypothetical protein